VEDQDKALAFYTDVLGFVRKTDIPLGEARWITVASAADPDGVELLLEPNGNKVARTYQEGVKAQGIPVTSFAVDDLQAEYERLEGLGVRFTQEPMQMGPVATAVFDDTCGNLIQLAQAT
jgi:catechol 2,3-dioxygenase-like lactoylglutathione lyase family enzyme